LRRACRSSGCCPLEDIATLLAQRCRALELEIAQERSLVQLVLQQGLPRLHVIENEYHLALREAEFAWVRTLVEEIRSGAVGDLAAWTATHRAMDQRSQTDAEAEEAEAPTESEANEKEE
jgi:hypothetical protein